MSEKAKTGDTVFGKKIRQRREELKLSRADVAVRIGGKCDASSIGGYEYGYYLPSANRLHALAAALDWSIDELVVNTELNVQTLRNFDHLPTPNSNPQNGKDEFPPVLVQLVPSEPVVNAPIETRNAYILGNGKLHGKDVAGSVPGWKAVMLCHEAYDDVCLEWASCLIDTAIGFAKVDMNAALVELEKRKPDWYIAHLQLIEPDLD